MGSDIDECMYPLVKMVSGFSSPTMNSLLCNRAGIEQLAGRVRNQPPSKQTVFLVMENTALALRLGEMYAQKVG
jgi:hypothetical protein